MKKMNLLLTASILIALFISSCDKDVDSSDQTLERIAGSYSGEFASSRTGASTAGVAEVNLLNQSTVFSETEHTTIEKYTIRLKVEKAKELLLMADHNISAVSEILGYSNPAYFSRQFHSITGFSPHHFIKTMRKEANL